MSEKIRKNLVKYGIAFAACLAFAAFPLFSRNPGAMARQDLYRTLSDAFTVPGLLCLFAGGLLWLSQEGAMDGVSYVLQTAVKSLLFMGRQAHRETYGEYVERRRAKKSGGFGFLLITGVVCLLIAGLFTLLFYFAK